MMLGSPDIFGLYGPPALARDVVYTPDWCAKDMVEYFKPAGRILEPCKGAGVFLKYLPPTALWCEISEGRDFFAWRDPVDWIITNPPWSRTREFLRYALTVADNIVFLVPARNIFGGYGTVRECHGWGAMAAIRWYGTGNTLNFPMGNAIAALHWKRGHDSKTITETFYEDEQRDVSLAAVDRGTMSATHGNARSQAHDLRANPK